MLIPQVSPWLGPDERDAAAATVDDNWITEGPRSAEFVARLLELTGSPYGVLAPNGTLALFLALLALEVGVGDEVIVPDITFMGSATAVALTGATPVFAEVNDRNFQLDLDDCRRVLTPKTRAVMPVHLFGMCTDMHAVMAFAREHGLFVVEDAAQAVGVRYKGQHAGTFGDIGCFSFFADKTITTGEGGFVVCNDEALYEKLRLIRNQGRLDRGSFIHPAVGYNFRMTDLQSAVGLVQLAKLPEIETRKRRILGWYHEELDDEPAVRFLEVEDGSDHTPFRAVVFGDRAHELMAHLAAQEIQPRTFFYPLHQQPCFQYLSREHGGAYDLGDEHYKKSIEGYQTAVVLPIFPTLAREQVARIGATIRDFYAHTDDSAAR